ncbi:MAG: GNAT family N-acetyltransferase [Chloroflexi bacterium]|nr:GNAT family N-acetyltransferase [Chloroflexota bacterium]
MPPPSVRQADWNDLDAILDLLAEYDVPRGFFEPRYVRDPTYQPYQSWVIEEARVLVAHLRVFDRAIRVHGTVLRVAGIGNVITARASRGRGYASLLLRTVLETLPGEGYLYSLLGAARPDLYRRYGWVPIEEQVVDVTLRTSASWPGRIDMFQDADLPEVMALYTASNAGRTGPTVRTLDYWRGQLGWLHEDRDGFLVARTPTGGLAGYVRSRRRPGEPTEILELGASADHPEPARPLLGRLAQRLGARLEARVPGSLFAIFRPEEPALRIDTGLMGRVLDVDALVGALRPLWEARLLAVGLAGAELALQTSAGERRVQVGAAGLPVVRVSEAQLAHLLFHGADASAGWLPPGAEAELLRALFPPQDFVMWPADDF